MAIENEVIMNIYVNDKPVEILEGSLLADLLKRSEYKRAAVIINGKHIQMSDYSSLILKKDDSVKIFRILGGG